MITAKDKKWLKLCEFKAQLFSTCAKRQYASVIIDTDGHVVGTGYNGAPPGMEHCIDGGCPRLFDNSPSGSKYDNCVSNHAELNALLHSTINLNRFGANTLYVNGTPCFGCAKAIAGSAIMRVVCYSDSSYEDWPRVKAFLQAARIIVEEIEKDGCE